MNEEKEVLFKKETKSLLGKIFIVTGANRGEKLNRICASTMGFV